MKRVDVLVVGAGPAGSSAARAAAAAGVSVMCVDRKKHAGEPVQCAEYVPGQVLSETGLASLAIQVITQMRSTVEDNETHWSNFRGYMISRVAFDQALLQQAGQSGAAIQLDTRMLELDAGLNQASLVHQGERYTVQYRVLIAADGPHSRVLQQLGLPRQECIRSRQISVPLLKPGSVTHTWLSRSYKGGYAWLFPKGDVANLGIGIGNDGEVAQAVRLSAVLKGLHQQLNDQGYVKSQILSKTGGAIPVGGLSSSLNRGDILFAGDAAGLAHPITGAGIAPAVLSGRLAGEAAASAIHQDSGQPLVAYAQELRAIFEPAWQHALQRRMQLLNTRQGSLRTAWIAFPEYFSCSVATRPVCPTVDAYGRGDRPYPQASGNTAS